MIYEMMNVKAAPGWEQIVATTVFLIRNSTEPALIIISPENRLANMVPHHAVIPCILTGRLLFHFDGVLAVPIEMLFEIIVSVTAMRTCLSNTGAHHYE